MFYPCLVYNINWMYSLTCKAVNVWKTKNAWKGMILATLVLIVFRSFRIFCLNYQGQNIEEKLVQLRHKISLCRISETRVIVMYWNYLKLFLAWLNRAKIRCIHINTINFHLSSYQMDIIDMYAGNSWWHSYVINYIEVFSYKLFCS